MRENPSLSDEGGVLDFGLGRNKSRTLDVHQCACARHGAACKATSRSPLCSPLDLR
jgi:hypothetical protein